MIDARWFIIGMAAILSAGCGKPGPAADAQSTPAADRAAVEATTTAFHDALRHNDLEKFMSYVADDVFFMPAGEPPIRGKEAMRTWMAGFLSQYRTTSLALADREVRTADGWAVELGTYEWGLAPAAGGATTLDHGNYMQVWQRRADGSWSFAREVYNSSMPPAPAN